MKLSKAEYDELPETVKSLFVEDGEDTYISQTEADASLKTKNSELLDDLKKRERELKAFDGLDADKAKQAITQMSEIEDKKLMSKQAFDELLEKREKEYKEKFDKIQDSYNKRFAGEADKDLQIKLIAAGVREDRAEDLSIILKSKHIKAVDEDGSTVWKTSDTEQTVDLDTFIPSLKDSKADFFKPTGASGSGASGSGNNGNSNMGEQDLYGEAGLASAIAESTI
ncbi:MAG: hypothetical protein ACR2MD_00995 [Aridibacter sp.]